MITIRVRAHSCGNKRNICARQAIRSTCFTFRTTDRDSTTSRHRSTCFGERERCPMTWFMRITGCRAFRRSFADAVIVVSKGISARIAGDIIPCGIDLEVFKPIDRTAARMRLGLPLRGKLVLFPFDPLRKIKRYELARAAVDTLSDPDAQIITVCGKRNEDMPWYYSAADVMVLCSQSEGSPTSVKEALACNIPVVSTDVGDVREIIDGIDGCEICGEDRVSLAQGLKRVLGRQSEKPFEGRSFMQRYDQSRVVAAILKVYERVIHDRLAGCRQQTQPEFP